MENNTITINVANIEYLLVSYSVEYNNKDFITLDIAGRSNNLPKYLLQCLHKPNYKTNKVLEHFSFKGYSISQRNDIRNFLQLYFDFNTWLLDEITENDIKCFKDKCTQHFLKHFSKIIPNYGIYNVKSSLDD